MKKTIIYLAILGVIAASIITLSGFQWYGDEAKDIKQGEKNLEITTGSELKYLSESPASESYVYTDEDSRKYLVNKTNGQLTAIIGTDIEFQSEITEVDKLKEAIKQEVVKYYPDFYDIDVEYEINEYSDFTTIYIYQTTKLGNRTGNFVYIRIEDNKAIGAMSFVMKGDITLADKEVKISEVDAIKIAYKAAESRMHELRQELIEEQTNIDPEQIKPGSDEVAYNDKGEVLAEDITDESIHILEVYLEKTDSHEVNTLKTIHNGTAVWIVEIGNVKNNMPGEYDDHVMQICVTLDANTGEILEVSYAL